MLESCQRVKPFKYVTRFVRVHACTVTPQTEAATQLIVEIKATAQVCPVCPSLRD
jgi:hypothetical protein